MTEIPADLIDAEALAVSYRVPESTIRTWAARGVLTRYPQGHRQRTLYSLAEFGRVKAGCEVHRKSACRTCFGRQE